MRTLLHYSISARVRSAPRGGYESSGRDIPTFLVSAADAESAARIVYRVLASANPDAEYIVVSSTGYDNQDYHTVDTHTGIPI